MTRDGHKWLVLRPEAGGAYVAARRDSDYVRQHKKTGTHAGSFRTMQKALTRAKELNCP